jgi:glycosyltransferase involved in cell wall biosynthesis
MNGPTSKANLKPCIVISGVSLTEMGPLAVFQDALASLATDYASAFDIYALVHRRSLFNVANVTYLEFPDVKSSWSQRLLFEYWRSNGINRRLRPWMWFAMDNMSPRVTAERQVVYCHNPSPFYRFSLRDFRLDWKFGLFTLFYRYLYGINIKRNQHVIVQQNWIRKKFQSLYGVTNTIVAHPAVDVSAISSAGARRPAGAPYRFFYPAYPRTFKNAEVLLRAARQLESEGFHGLELWLTFDAKINNYAAKIFAEFSDLGTVRWLGVLPRRRIFELYGEADCLLFPSKLETWGLPITEFKATGKPILAADLAYAHETVGDYSQTAFFDPGDARQLANIMRAICTGEFTFSAAHAAPIAMPFSRNWSELWALLLPMRPSAPAKPHPIIGR